MSSQSVTRSGKKVCAFSAFLLHNAHAHMWFGKGMGEREGNQVSRRETKERMNTQR